MLSTQHEPRKRFSLSNSKCLFCFRFDWQKKSLCNAQKGLEFFLVENSKEVSQVMDVHKVNIKYTVDKKRHFFKISGICLGNAFIQNSRKIDHSANIRSLIIFLIYFIITIT